MEESHWVLLDTSAVINQEFIPEECDPLVEKTILKEEEIVPEEPQRIKLEVYRNADYRFGIC